ncbi:dehydrodolichyl diphosphate synthase subunit [Arctopsyche grandis]|uniref:dehydrodolichyl diphosphate synthase subunit n=1 Tax=Arctopsyche grandis TaxID=121162 RepID=UPI00406D928E
MSWIKENALSWVQLFCVKVVKTGKVPRHIAFIMDGNRRFAKKNNILKCEGHSQGFEKLAEALQWCLDLGIPEVTVYAFSIENFKRSDEELETLMTLATEKFQRLLDESDLLMERGVCVRVVGKLSLLPAKLRSLIAKAMILTKDNDKATLNVAFAYTGRDEIATAVGDIVRGVKDGLISTEDITEELMDKTMQLSPPDLLVRTSGEVRLSDFLIWQVSNTCLYFTNVLWPEFKIWHLLSAIIYYQRVSRDECIQNNEDNDRQLNFLSEVNRAKWKLLEKYAQAC